MAISVTDVFDDPHAVADTIAVGQPLVVLEVLEHMDRRVQFLGTFQPPAAFVRDGYPTEKALIVVTRSGPPRAIPVGSARAWQHRNGPLELCLWFDGDPRGLRWEWDDGFASYVGIVHRHLTYEEYWRRTGQWPVEDVPHGQGDHPVRTLNMHWKAQLWDR